MPSSYSLPHLTYHSLSIRHTLFTNTQLKFAYCLLFFLFTLSLYYNIEAFTKYFSVFLFLLAIFQLSLSSFSFIFNAPFLSVLRLSSLSVKTLICTLLLSVTSFCSVISGVSYPCKHLSSSICLFVALCRHVLRLSLSVLKRQSKRRHINSVLCNVSSSACC